MYEVSKLIIQVIGQSKETKREVVLKLGYKNLEKGYRRLHHLIETGECPELMRKMLPTALGVVPQVVEDAFVTTARQKQEEVEIVSRCQEKYERRIFKPHLWIEHELLRPRSITIAVFTGVDNYKVVNLPEDINKLSWEYQVRVVEETIRQHQQNDGKENCIFGRVTGYVYRQTYDDSHLFSKNGVLLESNIVKFSKPEASLKIGGKEVRSELITKIIKNLRLGNAN